MSQTVTYKNPGFTDPNLLARTLTKLGWTMVGPTTQDNIPTYYSGMIPNDYHSRVWYQHQQDQVQPIDLCYDGDYSSHMEKLLGVGFNRLTQGYRLEQCQDAADAVHGELYQTQLEDGSIEVEICVNA